MTTTSSTVLESGVRISSPIYISLAAPEAKLQLNNLRAVCNADPTPVAARGGGISVMTSQRTALQAKAELALGMSLDVLRQQLLNSRSSLHLEQAILIQKLTGTEQFTRKDLERNFKAFLDGCYANAEEKYQQCVNDA